MIKAKTHAYDPAHDVLHYKHIALNSIFSPKNVAVIGASETPNSVGRTIMWNLVRNPFGGAVFPVNPKRASVLGVKAYPHISDLPEPVDLAVIVTPAKTVPGIISDCVENGVRGAIIISAGFKETGPEGVELENQILEHAERGKMRIIGPNCLGVMSPVSGMNATFAASMAHKGSVGFISQSGALCTAVLDWSLRENVGFSHFVSVGSMLDVGWGDLIYYLGDDPNTESIVIYMETIGDARAFLSAAREVANVKPIIVIKPGRTAGAAKAAASHTGSLTGSDEVLEVAFRRSGVLRVVGISDLFYLAEVLSKQPKPQGNRLTILTNAGGPGVLATDALITHGGELAVLSDETMKAFDEILPDAWSHNNPVDILGDASPERYAKSIEIAAKDPNSDGLMVILTPQDMTDPTKTAQEIVPFANSLEKPIICSWMGGDGVSSGENILNQANIPAFPYPDTAAQMFDYMANYTAILQRLYETPIIAIDEKNPPQTEKAKKIIEDARKDGRTILTEFESKELLSAYGIPTVETRIAKTSDAAIEAAEEIGYPVVLKLHSETITHKSDVGGVQLNLNDAEEVKKAFTSIKKTLTEHVGKVDESGKSHFLGVTVQPMASLKGYELILGSSIDSQFGPVILFGMGGTLVEVFKDSSLGIPPLNTTLARRMMEHTKIYNALKGVRGEKSVNLQDLERILVRFSNLISEQRWIKELDINPLIASSEQILSLDARVLLFGKEVKESELPQLAIRPYPVQYISYWKTKDGKNITIRPIRAEDEPLIVQFHATLSDRSVYLRYLHPMLLSDRAAHERLSRICHCDYEREITIIADHEDAKEGELRIMGALRMTKLHGTDRARFSLLISDLCQGMGIGSELMEKLIPIAREEKIKCLEAIMTSDNESMQALGKRFGFTFSETDEGMTKMELAL
jgi:acetyltransferase